MKVLKRFLCLVLFLVSFSKAFSYEGTVLEDRVRVRNSPSVKYSQVVGIVNKGEKLAVTGYTTELDEIDGKKECWYQVRFSGSDYEYCYIYGGYFKPDVDKSELYSVDKTEAAGYVLWNLIDGSKPSVVDIYDSHAIDSYYEKGKNVKNNGNEYLFEYGSFKFVLEYSYGDMRWKSMEMFADVNNPLNIKLGISVEEVKKAFGRDVKLNEWLYFGRACAAFKLNCSDGVLKSISFTVLED